MVSRELAVVEPVLSSAFILLLYTYPFPEHLSLHPLPFSCLGAPIFLPAAQWVPLHPVNSIIPSIHLGMIRLSWDSKSSHWLPFLNVTNSLYAFQCLTTATSSLLCIFTLRSEIRRGLGLNHGIPFYSTAQWVVGTVCRESGQGVINTWCVHYGLCTFQSFWCRFSL